MAGIHITDIEAAINHWRIKNPSPDGVSLPPELRALAEVYGLMVYLKQDLADEFSLPLAAPPPTRPALPFARPARATKLAKAVAAASKRCSCGPK
jgi:hypothetical protein